jgi:hypothetical protein
MHTVMVVAAGLVALASLAGAAALAGRSAGTGARLFILPWLAAALVNLYVGTTHGYSVAGELPFFAIVFGVPALAAWGVMRWSASRARA